MKKYFIIYSALAFLSIAVFLNGCGTTTQTTSGQSYLDKYKNIETAENSATGGNINAKIRQAAAVEPTLQFPARIGLARIKNGKLAPVPGAELEIWKELQSELGTSYGEFVPVNPMIASMVSNAMNADKENAIDQIRLGAARQHLDAVFIYEVYSNEDGEANILSLANLTIIGAFILPSESVSVESFASGMLIDVIQGYPYATIDTQSKDKRMATSAGAGSASMDMAEKTTLEAVKSLKDEAKSAIQSIRLQLAEKAKR